MYALALVALSIAAAPETRLGSGVTLEQSTPIASVLENPERFAGKTIRIDGVATAVCSHMGCWMAVAPDGEKDARTIRLKVDDGAIVFPVSAKGKQVSAQGVVEEVKGAEAAEAAGEHAKHDATASKQYQITATGAVIKQ